MCSSYSCHSIVGVVVYDIMYVIIDSYMYTYINIYICIHICTCIYIDISFCGPSSSWTSSCRGIISGWTISVDLLRNGVYDAVVLPEDRFLVSYK